MIHQTPNPSFISFKIVEDDPVMPVGWTVPNAGEPVIQWMTAAGAILAAVIVSDDDTLRLVRYGPEEGGDHA